MITSDRNGLDDPRTGRWPHAVVQLRQDNALGTLWNIVGFQTKLKHAEQVRLFRTIPWLENAEFARLGGIHRNTYLNSPELLDPQLRLKADPRLRFVANPDNPGFSVGCNQGVADLDPADLVAAEQLLVAAFALRPLVGGA